MGEHKPWCEKTVCVDGDFPGEHTTDVCLQPCTCERRKGERRMRERRAFWTPDRTREWERSTVPRRTGNDRRKG